MNPGENIYNGIIYTTNENRTLNATSVTMEYFWYIYIPNCYFIYHSRRKIKNKINLISGLKYVL